MQDSVGLEPGDEQHVDNTDDEEAALTTVARPRPEMNEPEMNEPRSQTPADEENVEIDGDATVIVPASQLPAGTGHLHSDSESRQD
ncbi:MAG: hypothetical protein H0T91_08955 [Propionibacteriaceae bacterium]|nr:hypothetical protein [Propionibacteriaceae bacterium]